MILAGILTLSINDQLEKTAEFKQNDTQLILVKYIYHKNNEIKYFTEPLLTFTDVFMQTTYSGENSLLKKLSGIYDNLDLIDDFRLEVVIPFDTKLFLEYEQLESCNTTELCNEFSSEAQETCWKFKVVNTSSNEAFPLEYIGSTKAEIFSKSNFEGYFLEPGLLSYIIELKNGKFDISTKEFVCKGPSEMSQEKLVEEDFINERIKLDTRIMCVSNCIKEADGGRLQAYRSNYTDTTAIFSELKDIQFYFAWSGTLKNSITCRSERESWFYYLQYQPAESLVDAVIKSWQ